MPRLSEVQGDVVTSTSHMREDQKPELGQPRIQAPMQEALPVSFSACAISSWGLSFGLTRDGLLEARSAPS